MKRFTALLFGIVLGGGIIYLAVHYHVVRAAEGHLVVPKNSATIADTYVDVRQWNAADWQTHPALMAAVVHHGRADLVATPTSRDILRGLFQKLRGTDPSATNPRDSQRE